MRVLVADRNESLTEIMGQMLNEAGVLTRRAHSVSEIVKCLDRERMDYIITGALYKDGAGSNIVNSICETDPLYTDRIIFYTGAVLGLYREVKRMPNTKIFHKDQFRELIDYITQKPASKFETESDFLNLKEHPRR